MRNYTSPVRLSVTAVAVVASWLVPATTLPAQAANLPPCKVGLHVPLVSPLNYGATILEFDATKGTYKVKSDADGLTDWVPARTLRYSCSGSEAAAITEAYFVGDWSLFVGPTAHHEVIDDKGYLVVGPGAHIPPLRINVDNTYVWIIDSRTTIRGRWRTMAASELKSGTKAPAILLLNGESGRNWEVSRNGVNQGNNRDAIGVERMDIGVTASGTRISR